MPLGTVEGHPPGDGPPPAPRHAAPTGHVSQWGSAGPPHPHTRGHSTWVADPDSPPRRRAAGGWGAPEPRRPSQRRKAPPHRDAPPSPPQRATTARKGARCGTGAGSPRPHQPHPGQTGRGTPAARPRRRAAKGGTAPDTRRPSQRGKANPPGDAPLQHLRGTQPPTGQASQRDSACWASTPANLRPQHMGSGPRRPTQRTRSRGRGSA